MRRIFHNPVPMATGIRLPSLGIPPLMITVSPGRGGVEGDEKKKTIRWLSRMKYFPRFFFHPCTRFRQGIRGSISSGVNWSFFLLSLILFSRKNCYDFGFLVGTRISSKSVEGVGVFGKETGTDKFCVNICFSSGNFVNLALV
ncbi:hypothetical protein CEXT_246481 [Caerostris extrusa]|uniref:Uncharacterized protein n=1 Tax=Caerostris extrusa TaxID=172846 RepID=A0AAV4XFE6_CAEEX|nr:hypothetical protein CEXT_246481 [Caerostris extrusa]